ncbi:unnamed protein product [Plutella xylostella]|uniref:(diamondback moth) hypothetical protein n=1 Tax=Plutella xylostella TaxID=51655 RepID=A0A8S4F1A3_PLUXY|nr:unnamed protein product [Plutella xylostella]
MKVYLLAKPSSSWVEVEVSEPGSAEAVEQRYSAELRARLRDTQAEALLLYTEYSARTGGDLKTFFANMTGFKEEVVRGIGREYDSAVCVDRATVTQFPVHSTRREYALSVTIARITGAQR